MSRSRSAWLWLLSGAAALAALGTGVGAQEAALDWPRFRGLDGRATGAGKGFPSNWGATQNVVWKTELPGAGTSSPIVVGPRVFLTCFSGYNVPGRAPGSQEQLKLHLVCLDRDSGKLVWDRTVAPRLPEQARIRENHGYASSTPAADATRVYAFFGRSGVVAFDHDGREQWRADVGDRVSDWGSAASPVLFGDLVLINASVESQSVVALDRKTGKEVWRAGGIREAWNTPVVAAAPDGKPELVVPIMGKVFGLDPATGKQLWSCNTEIPWYMVPSPVAADGIVYCIGGRGDGIGALAIRLGGRGDVTRSHRLWLTRKGSNVSSPVLHDGHLYWMHDGLDVAYCADAKTGKIVYEERVPRAGGFYASPVLADGKLYCVARTGRTFVLPAAPTYRVLAVNELGERGVFDSSPAAVGGRLLLRSNRYLYYLGAKQ